MALSPLVTVVREPIAGMHCASCERLIEDELTDLPGVESATANARRGFVEYRADSRFKRRSAKAALARYGYHLGVRPYWLTRTPRVWRDVGIGLVIVLAITTAARAGAFEFVSGWLGNLDASSLALPLLVGVAAGFSTCLATVGGLVLAASSESLAARPGGVAMRPHLMFNAGRVVGFAVLGALMGALGSVISLGPIGLALAMIAAALVMIAVSLQLTTISPRLAGLAPSLPRWTRRLITSDSRKGSRFGPDATAAGLGVLSFFVPCGFTQAVQIFALSTGSPAQASLILAAFALGTAPALLTLGGVPALARRGFRDTFLRIAGVVVAALAVVNLISALGILGVRLGGSDAVPEVISENVTIVDGVQVATMTSDGYGYVPADTVVYVDMPVRWEIRGTGLSCGSWLVAPELGVPADAILLPNETSVFEFTLSEPGTVDFACNMGMYRGTMTAITQPN